MVLNINTTIKLFSDLSIGFTEMCSLLHQRITSLQYYSFIYLLVVAI